MSFAFIKKTPNKTDFDNHNSVCFQGKQDF